MNGYRFRVYRENKPKNSYHNLNWLCVHHRCKGSITVQINKNEYKINHQHWIPDDDIRRPIDLIEIKCKEFESKCKLRAQVEDLSINKIYDQEEKALYESSS